MTKIKLPGLNRMVDRHGKERWYFRRDGKRTPLPDPDAPGFAAAYEAARDRAPPPVGAGRDAAGTFSALIASWLGSADFKGKSEGTRRTYRYDAERFRKRHGHRLVADLKAEHVEKIMAAMGDKRAAANKARQFLRQLMKHAIKTKLIKAADNPMLHVEKVKRKRTPERPDGFAQWGHRHIAQFREHWPLGTAPRLALELLLCTAARRSDAVRLGPQDIHDGCICFRAAKTGEEMEVPISPALEEALDAMAVRPIRSFVATAYGRPFTGGGFYNWLTAKAREAGLPKGYGVHGLRKSAAAHLRERGYSVPEIAALGGWKSLALVELYTRGADRRLTLKNAMDREAAMKRQSGP